MRDRERRYEDDQRKRGQKTDRRWQNHNFKENVMLFFFAKLFLNLTSIDRVSVHCSRAEQGQVGNSAECLYSLCFSPIK